MNEAIAALKARADQLLHEPVSQVSLSEFAADVVKALEAIAAALNPPA